MIGDDLAPDPLCLPWRTGGDPAVAVLALVGEVPVRRYVLVGVMSSANDSIRAHLAGVELGNSPAA